MRMSGASHRLAILLLCGPTIAFRATSPLGIHRITSPSNLPMHRFLHSPSNMSSSSSSQQEPDSGRLLISVMDRIGTSVHLVLASQSPRRREILDMMGLGGKYTTQPSPLDEESLQTELMAQKLSPTDYTHHLAQAKAHALAVAQASSLTTTTFYLGSDTIVELDDMVLEKPKSTDQAKEMLRKLSGNVHHVHTAVAIYKVKPGSEATTTTVSHSFVDTAQVTFTTLSEQDIEAYVQSGEPMDKAGSYGIQGIGGQFVSGLTGDFFTVMGLPMHKTSRALAQAIIRDEEA